MLSSMCILTNAHTHLVRARARAHTHNHTHTRMHTQIYIQTPPCFPNCHHTCSLALSLSCSHPPPPFSFSLSLSHFLLSLSLSLSRCLSPPLSLSLSHDTRPLTSISEGKDLGEQGMPTLLSAFCDYGLPPISLYPNRSVPLALERRYV